ncbi:MAG TPA: hypothetical protein VGM81_02000 [Burkholderiaceae bacterium]|jgi:hypothetical protein
MILHIACELMLAICCALNLFTAWRHRAYLAILGFGLIGLAAQLGAVVYAGVQAAVAPHDTATFLAARLGLLLIAARGLRDARWAVGVALVCGVALLAPSPADLAISVLALVAIAWKGRSRHWLLAIAGAVLFALVGLLVGGPGEWLGIPRVDLYHLGLAAALLLWLRAGLIQRGQRRG